MQVKFDESLTNFHKATLLGKIVSNFYVNIKNVESWELQVPGGNIDFLIKQVSQIATNQNSKQFGWYRTKKSQNWYLILKKHFMLSTGNQYFEKN
jgi:hypothetical protein